MRATDEQILAAVDSDVREAAQPQPVRIYKLGPWPEAQTTADVAARATPLGQRLVAYLSGEPVEMDADLARVVLKEFGAQERYRARMVHWLNVACERMQAAQVEAKVEEAQPTGTGAAFAHGFSMGERKAYLECAQIVKDALNGAADAVAEYVGVAAEALGDARNGEPGSKP